MEIAVQQERRANDTSTRRARHPCHRPVMIGHIVAGKTWPLHMRSFHGNSACCHIEYQLPPPYSMELSVLCARPRAERDRVRSRDPVFVFWLPSPLIHSAHDPLLAGPWHSPGTTRPCLRVFARDWHSASCHNQNNPVVAPRPYRAPGHSDRSLKFRRGRLCRPP